MQEKNTPFLSKFKQARVVEREKGKNKSVLFSSNVY
jgi:hypothetical protein